MSDEQNQPQVTFHYLKSNYFRVIHCDGIIGGTTPQGNLHFAMYSERPAFPQVRTHTVTDGGKLDEAFIRQLSRDGIVRELEVDAVMDFEKAIALRDWLSQRIEEHQKLSKNAPTNKVD